jgi:Mrp family chromosome partitioning ATPase
MSSIADALKRAEQERERLRAPASAAGEVSAGEHPEASLASVVLRKAPETQGGGSVPPPTAPSVPVTPLADAIRTRPASAPSPRAVRQKSETIVEDYASKRNLNLPASMVVYHDRAGRAAAQYRQVRDGLMAGNPKREHQVLVITSAVAREGKTVTVMNLGLSLAEIRANRVLLVDGCLHAGRRGRGGGGSLSELMRLGRERGVGELLAEPEGAVEGVIQATPWHNLFVLPCGARTTPVGAAQLLQSERLRTVLRQLRATFDWVLVDAPAALALPDAGLFGALADGVHLAVALHHTAEGKVQTTLRRLRSMNLPVKSAILTRA